MPIMDVGGYRKEKEKLLYSEYQMAIFGEVKNSTDNLIIEAVAGSGKTTTIVDAMELLPIRSKSIFLAFNKAIATELALKVPTHVQSRTLHSLGYEILRDNFQKVRSNGKYVMNSLKFEVLDRRQQYHKDWAWDNGLDVCKIISRLKGQGLTAINDNIIYDLINHLELDIPADKFTMATIKKLWEKVTSFDGYDEHTIDFDDMIYIPSTRDMQFPQYDVIMLDEAQDLNRMQREFVKKILAPTGRLIAVGDTGQAIYGFRGADHNSMGKIKHEFACKELPLSISYRCATSIVKCAQQFVPEITARKGAPEGFVSSIDISDLTFMLEIGDHVLCRTWAPLVKQAIKLGMSDNNVCVLGNDIVPSILKMAKDVEKLYGRIDKSCVWDTYELKVSGLSEGQAWKAYSMRDKCQVLSYVVENDTLTVKQVQAILKDIFSDKPPIGAHITLSTIHKAKGLEADRIFILRPDLLPHPLAKGHNEIIQEMNLHYVAITRAKKELYYVTQD